MRRRLEQDLRTILDGSVHYSIEPIRGDDARASKAKLDRQHLKWLRDRGSFAEKGLIFGGKTMIAHRPFVTETIDAIRSIQRALEETFVRAKFSSVLERYAFNARPKNHKDDHGASTEEQWHEVWLRITYGQYTKALACEAIELDEHAYDERRRRPRAKADGLSINDQELQARLHELIAEEQQKLADLRQTRDYVVAVHGVRLPRALRSPAYSRRTRGQLHRDCRFLDDDLVRWRASLKKQPAFSHQLWRQLIRLREQRVAGVVATFAIHELITQMQSAQIPS